VARVVIYETNVQNAGKLAARKVMQPMLENAAAAAAASSPVNTGDYANSFQVRMLTWVGIVANVDPAAAHIEFGTSDTPKHRVLGRAVDSFKVQGS
jgi:hypothetical protein